MKLCVSDQLMHSKDAMPNAQYSGAIVYMHATAKVVGSSNSIAD